jgi:hypothetical protein
MEGTNEIILMELERPRRTAEIELTDHADFDRA